MTPEEKMQRNMEFIVEQQAQFVTNIQLLQEQQTEITTKIDRLTDSQRRAEDSRGKDASRLDRAERVLKLMVRAGQRGRRELRDQDTRIAALINTTEQLTEIVRQLATKQNGNGTGGA